MVKSEVLDRALSALADPTRRDILERLGRGPATISELAQPLGISLPGLMKHVGILERARLVETRKNGRARECRLGPGDLDEVATYVKRHKERWEQRLDRFESYLADKKKGER